MFEEAGNLVFLVKLMNWVYINRNQKNLGAFFPEFLSSKPCYLPSNVHSLFNKLPWCTKITLLAENLFWICESNFLLSPKIVEMEEINWCSFWVFPSISSVSLMNSITWKATFRIHISFEPNVVIVHSVIMKVLHG